MNRQHCDDIAEACLTYMRWYSAMVNKVCARCGSKSIEQTCIGIHWPETLPEKDRIDNANRSECAKCHLKVPPGHRVMDQLVQAVQPPCVVKP